MGQMSVRKLVVFWMGQLGSERTISGTEGEKSALMESYLTARSFSVVRSMCEAVRSSYLFSHPKESVQTLAYFRRAGVHGLQYFFPRRPPFSFRELHVCIIIWAYGMVSRTWRQRLAGPCASRLVWRRIGNL